MDRIIALGRNMLGWLKRFLAKEGINDLDRLIPVLSEEIEKAKSQIQKMDSQEMATWFVKRIQLYLRTYFKIEP